VLFIAWVVGAVCAKFFSYHQTRGLLYEQGRVLSESLVNIMGVQGGSQVVKATLDTAAATQLIYGWRDGQLIMRQGAYELPVPTQTKTYVEELNGVKWILNSHCAGTNCVLVGFRDQERKYLVRRIVVAIFAGVLLILALAMVAMYYAIRSGLKPLENLTRELSESDVSKLNEVQGHDNAKELKPLVNALNQLMTNMRKQLEKERHFLDTCTHELRTPVAGLVAQIQSVSQPSSSNSHYQSIKHAADRTIRMANQFLSLAKNKNAQALETSKTNFDLPELVRQVSAEILQQHENVNCQLNGVATLSVNADSLAIEMVVRNLLENACRYGRKSDADEVQIQIRLEQVEANTLLTVEDNGEGVPKEGRRKLTQRFFRIAQPSPQQTKNQFNHHGAGLGLSIVEEVANRYAGTVNIDRSQQLGGLRVSVSFQGIINTNEPRNCGKKLVQGQALNA